jgi:hypothetical protein
MVPGGRPATTAAKEREVGEEAGADRQRVAGNEELVGGEGEMLGGEDETNGGEYGEAAAAGDEVNDPDRTQLGLSHRDRSDMIRQRRDDPSGR